MIAEQDAFDARGQPFNSEVQCGQRVAFRGMVERQYGQALVVGVEGTSTTRSF